MEIDLSKLCFDKINEKLTHLNNDQIIKLITEYYGGINVNDLLNRYEIDIRSSQLYSIFPSIETEEICPNCNEKSRAKLPSKTSFNFSSWVIYCPHCSHRYYSKCICDYCLAEKARKNQEKDKVIEERQREEREKEIAKRKIIERTLENTKFNKIREEDLTLIDKLYLTVLCKGYLTEDLSYILSYESKEIKMTPNENFDIDIIDHLVSRGIIIPHSNSPLYAFNIEDNKFTYYSTKTNYRLNIRPHDEDYSNLIKRIIYPNRNEFVNDQEFCFKIWRTISFYEVLEFLEYRMNKVKFDFILGEKTNYVIEHLLDNYSVSQIMNLIYRSVANVSSYYLENKITKRHAANTVISHLEKLGDRTMANNWQPKSYSRNFDLPESLISSVFFDYVLEISELGFLEKPSKLT